MKELGLLKMVCIVFAVCAATAIASPAQVFTTLHSFDGSDGLGPYGGLIQAADRNLYGTTGGRGLSGFGTVFKITPNGTLTVLHSFCTQVGCPDGSNPYARLAQATDGNFYGTTNEGGNNNDNCWGSSWGFGGCGTVFKITPEGTLTTLHRFDRADGGNPWGGLVQATDGNLYGTTVQYAAGGYGTVFKITLDGTFTTLYTFCSQPHCTDGAAPTDTLIQASDGNFYGTTSLGGSDTRCDGGQGCGTVFSITPEGVMTTLHSFNYDQGGNMPSAGLVQGADGNFYGTTDGEGDAGTVFKITPDGTFTTLYNFCSQQYCLDGSYPVAGLVQATDGNLYGTTANGGTFGSGTVFKISPEYPYTLTTLYNFNRADGNAPTGAVVQANYGNFYGTTLAGGAHGYGTVFRLVPVRACIVCPSVE